MIELAPGLQLHAGFFDHDAQTGLIGQLREAVEAAPLFTPTMPRTGTPFSVRMSNCGPLGWVSDRTGYRYQPNHPVTGQAWPAIPAVLLATWDRLCEWPQPPEACLVNVYRAGARMGLHQDRDEEALDAPIMSVSLGDHGVFRFGGTSRRDPTRSVRLSSGDVLVIGGAARNDLPRRRSD